MFNKSGSFVYAVAFALIGFAIYSEQKLGAGILFAIAVAFAADGIKKMKERKAGPREPEAEPEV